LLAAVVATSEASSSLANEFLVDDSNANSDSLDILLKTSDWALPDPASDFGLAADGEQFNIFNSSNDQYTMPSYMNTTSAEGKFI
jgi:hypothetical protein